MPVLLCLLIAGAACLLVGVLFASSPWLIAALVLGAVAAVLLYRRRYRIGKAAGEGFPRPGGQVLAPVAAALVTGTAFAARGGSGRTPVAAPRSDLRVWVVDGRPGYHLGQCPMLDDVPAGAVPELVPLAQALEDGFVACPTCEPSEERVAQGSAAVVGSSGTAGQAGTGEGEDVVWVVDGRPRYHRPGCVVLAGVPAEPVPRTQARADGFTPCPRCDPESGRG